MVNQCATAHVEYRHESIMASLRLENFEVLIRGGFSVLPSVTSFTGIFYKSAVFSNCMLLL